MPESKNHASYRINVLIANFTKTIALINWNKNVTERNKMLQSIARNRPVGRFSFLIFIAR
jgi:hypothetical protein